MSVEDRQFAADLARYGPEAPRPARPPSLRSSRRYCRRLARRHYENFTVASWLLPRALRPHVCHVYAYARWADDLADEPGDPGRSLALLDWWEGELHACYEGNAVHPVFVALADTIRRFDLPREPLVDLLVAFRQDLSTARYETPDQVLEYCRYSANPVGRLVLCLGRCNDAGRARLADAVCTGLQLANFCQDVAEDWDRGRVYLPWAHCRRHGYVEEHFARRECNDAFRRLLSAEVDEAEGWLRRGIPLVGRMPEGLQLPVALFIRGGLAILDAIRRADFDVWTRRPTVAGWQKIQLAAECWWRLRGGTLEEV
ncbi:MAG: squalene synthase HpnC [Pirellulales bacterium]|nr:squalene synthase HpnC [Pirellulales bacterium]